jgi:AcrR family transcriptional regulator
MTVDDLMARTGLSRPSFYEYFRDRHDLVIKLVERLRDLVYPMSDRWFSGQGDPRKDLKSGFEGLLEVYRQHGHLLRALADAAAQDRQVAEAYNALLSRLIDATARRIRSEIKRGRTDPLNAEETARALILMGERYVASLFAGESEPDIKTGTETLTTIWMRVLYERRR